MDKVRLEVPARPEFVGVVRLAVTTLARSVGLDEDRVDDLKIAVSEACTNAMQAASDAGSDITVAWESGPEGAIVEVGGPGAVPPPPDEDATSPRHSFSNDLLAALLDGYEVDSGPEGSVARLRISLA